VTGPPPPPFAAGIFQRSIGMPLAQAVQVTNDARFLTAVLPSANVIGTPRETSRFLALLLGEGQLDGTRLMSAASVRKMVTDVTPLQLDGTFGMPMRYGLGVMMGGTKFSLFGLNTPKAFGHLGLSNVVVFADPERDLAVTFLNSGKPLMDHGMLRWYWVLQRLVMAIPKR
jgi:CubicO group peptidase (beta-lactamase class C family)